MVTCGFSPTGSAQHFEVDTELAWGDVDDAQHARDPCSVAAASFDKCDFRKLPCVSWEGLYQQFGAPCRGDFRQLPADCWGSLHSHFLVTTQILADSILLEQIVEADGDSVGVVDVGKHKHFNKKRRKKNPKPPPAADCKPCLTSRGTSSALHFEVHQVLFLTGRYFSEVY